MPTADDILEQLVNPEMLRQLRAQQAAQPPAAVPPPPTPDNTIAPLSAPPPLPTITQPLPRDAGVAPGSAPGLPPRMTGDQFVQQPGGPQIPLPSNATFPTGANSPTLLPTTGSERVAADPEWRQRWDAGREIDSRNKAIQALGGPIYGSPGAIPTLRQAQQAIPGLTPTEYAHLLGTGGQLDQGQTKLGLETAQTLGVGGIPGSIQNNATTVAQQGRAAEIANGPDARLAAAYQTFINQRVAAGANIMQAKREWQAAGNALPQFAGGTPISNILPGSVATAPLGTQTVQTQTINNPPPTGEAADIRLNQIFDTVQRRQAANTAGGQRSAVDPITDFVSSLGEGFINNNTKDVTEFLMDRFGGPAMDAWFTARGSYFGPQTPQQRAIRSLQNAANRIAPGTVGSNAVNPQTPVGQAVLSTPAAMFLPHE